MRVFTTRLQPAVSPAAFQSHEGSEELIGLEELLSANEQRNPNTTVTLHWSGHLTRITPQRASVTEKESTFPEGEPWGKMRAWRRSFS